MYEEAKSMYEYKIKQIEEEKSRIERLLREELEAKNKEIGHLKTVENEHEEQQNQAIKNLQQEIQRLKQLENENKGTLKRLDELERENDELKQQKRAFESLQQLNKELTTELNQIKREDEEKLKRLDGLQRENDVLKRARYEVEQLELQNVSVGTVMNTQQGTNTYLKGMAVNYYSHKESPETMMQRTRHMVSEQLKDTGLATTESDLQSNNTEQTENQMVNTLPSTIPNINRMTEDMAKLEANQELVDLSESLHTSCMYGTLQNVKELIDSGKDVNGRDRRNMTPLMYCARSVIHPVPKIKLLMSYNESEINHKDGNSDSILHHACREGTLDTVQYLVQNIGMDVNIINLKGRTPLFDCCQSKIDAIAKIELLVAEGANILDPRLNEGLSCCCT
ncbi:ankyrin repeat domain-containing protein 1-like [Patella vulgata]|uniref:ankyrin repeat domain-containing protein 1-like n=1 Tax=Patella vulgata TaxID=6465 RepID=UPI0024A9F57E|nr:ankyrin repeat domain-containing protein 1-like [Patella vulgata]